jgi:GntR family transcriptional regulator/MocR family aminotransferase
VLRGNGETSFVPFQHGIPAVDKFPFDMWTKLYAKVFHSPRRDILGYGDPAGHYPLREAIAAHLRSARGVNCDVSQIIITNGAQQAFDLAGRVLLEPGAPVWVEDPCHAGAKNSFELSGAKLVPVAVDDEGFDITAALAKNGPARMIYVTPSHQFPLGMTMGLSRRLSLLEWAKNNEAWIIEDDYDSEFRYAGRPLASLQGLDKDNRVIYVGTFSKTIYPALRVGCLVVPKDMVKVFTAARALSGGNSPSIDQAVLAEFIDEGHFARHVRRMRRLYQERQALLFTEIERHLSGRLGVEKMDAGMHLVGMLAKGFKADIIVQKAAEVGVKVSTVSSYKLTGPSDNRLLLGYAGINEKQIKEGVKKLARVFDNYSK